MEETLQHEETTQCAGLSPAGSGIHHPDGNQANHALTINLDPSDRATHLSPSHANKKGIRYRYYVSRNLVMGRKQDATARDCACQQKNWRHRYARPFSGICGLASNFGSRNCPFRPHTRSWLKPLTIRVGCSALSNLPRFMTHVCASKWMSTPLQATSASITISLSILI